MNLTQKLFIKLSSMLISLCSCQGNEQFQEGERDLDTITVNRERKMWFYDSTQQVEIVADYLNDTLDGQLLEYYPNGILKAKEFYKRGRIIDSAYYYYETGVLYKKHQYLDYYAEDDYFLNTWIVYNENGKIIEEESHYYTILNSTDSFKYHSEAFLQFELTCPFFNDKSAVHLGEFDDAFKPLGQNIQKTEINDFRVSVPLNTNFLGKRTIRFIVDDYRWKNDSVQQVKPVLVKYDYVVW